MFIYNVTVKIDTDLAADWLSWMQTIHIPDVMATGLFLNHRICRLLSNDNDGLTYAIQYECADLATLQRYSTQYAPKLQADHANRYANKYVAFRTVMEVL